MVAVKMNLPNVQSEAILADISRVPFEQALKLTRAVAVRLPTD